MSGANGSHRPAGQANNGATVQSASAGAQGYSTTGSVSGDATNRYAITVSVETYSDHKPTGNNENRIIREGLKNPCCQQIVTLEKLEGFIRDGHTLMFGEFRGGTRKEHWQSQRLFALDFDNDDVVVSNGFDILEPLDALEIAYSKNLIPALLYFTKSATIDPYNPRYRIVFDAGKTFRDYEVTEAYSKSLCGIYPEADPASMRLTQMYHAGNGEIWPAWKIASSQNRR